LLCFLIPSALGEEFQFLCCLATAIFRAIESNVLVVDIPDAARRKLWAWLSANNASLGIRRDPNDSWISNS
jgi:hypothetical protein